MTTSENGESARCRLSPETLAAQALGAVAIPVLGPYLVSIWAGARFTPTAARCGPS